MEGLRSRRYPVVTRVNNPENIIRNSNKNRAIRNREGKSLSVGGEARNDLDLASLMTDDYNQKYRKNSTEMESLGDSERYDSLSISRTQRRRDEVVHMNRMTNKFGNLQLLANPEIQYLSDLEDAEKIEDWEEWFKGTYEGMHHRRTFIRIKCLKQLRANGVDVARDEDIAKYLKKKIDRYRKRRAINGLGLLKSNLVFPRIERIHGKYHRETVENAIEKFMNQVRVILMSLKKETYSSKRSKRRLVKILAKKLPYGADLNRQTLRMKPNLRDLKKLEKYLKDRAGCIRDYLNVSRKKRWNTWKDPDYSSYSEEENTSVSDGETDSSTVYTKRRNSKRANKKKQVKDKKIYKVLLEENQKLKSDIQSIIKQQEQTTTTLMDKMNQLQFQAVQNHSNPSSLHSTATLRSLDRIYNNTNRNVFQNQMNYAKNNRRSKPYMEGGREIRPYKVNLHKKEGDVLPRAQLQVIDPDNGGEWTNIVGICDSGSDASVGSLKIHGPYCEKIIDSRYIAELTMFNNSKLRASKVGYIRVRAVTSNGSKHVFKQTLIFLVDDESVGQLLLGYPTLYRDNLTPGQAIDKRAQKERNK